MTLFDRLQADIQQNIQQQSTAYLSNPDSLEWEASLGTGNGFYGKINKGTFQDVLRYLKHSTEFTPFNSFDDEQLDVTVHPSKRERDTHQPFQIRKTFRGRKAIVGFCKEEPDVLDLALNVYKSREVGEVISKVDINDFGVRLNLKSEVEVSNTTNSHPTALQEYRRLEDYLQRKGGVYRVQKTFRYKKRFSYLTTSGFRYDLTIIKSSPNDYYLNRGGRLVPTPKTTRSVQEINLLNQPESYEIEIEVARLDLFKQWLESHLELVKSINPSELEGGEEPEVGETDMADSLGKMLMDQVETILKIMSECPIPTSATTTSEVIANYTSLVSGLLTKTTTDSESMAMARHRLETFRDRITALQVNDGDNPYVHLTNIRRVGSSKRFDADGFRPHFVGPKPVSFELSHLQSGSSVTKNFKYYSITDKADGEGNLLYFDPTGEAYLINSNLQVRSCGFNSSDNANSLCNGEYITKTTQGESISDLYLYDAYIYRNQLVCNHPLMFPEPTGKVPVKVIETPISEMSRLECLKQLSKSLESAESSGISIHVKKFYYPGSFGFDIDSSIFTLAKACWTPFTSGETRYPYDGLIFTPMYEPAAYSSKESEFDRFQGKTWSNNLKWKPPEENTIDFLVETQKEEVFRKGNVKIQRETTRTTTSVSDTGKTEIQPYKTLNLYVGGLQTNKVGNNPCRPDRRTDESAIYGKILFEPTEPYQPNVYEANIPLSGQQMLGKGDGSIIEDNTIVEFSYHNPDDPSGFFQWVPKRTRFDKTFEYHKANEHRRLIRLYLEAMFTKGRTDANITRSPQWKYLNFHRSSRARPGVTFDPSSGRTDRRLTVHGFFQLLFHYSKQPKGPEAEALFAFLQRMFPKILPTIESIPVRTNFGNDTKTANSVWSSIHVPVTVSMITTGHDIPPLEVTDEVYYEVPTDSRDKSSTIHLQRFHNYIKRNVMLIPASSTLSSGKACNVLDLACGKGGDLQKWCDMKAKIVVGVDISRDNLENIHNGACQRYETLRNKDKPKAYWFQADSKLPLSQTLHDNKEYQSLWSDGESPKFIQNQFPIISLQFALHYFFEHKSSLTGLLENVNANLQVGGVFIGTCLNGKRLFDRLRGRDSIQGDVDGRLLWKIDKKYSQDSFLDDDSCLHYPIQVYMASIGKSHPEYLVNFEYFRKIVAQHPYYLEPLNREEVAEFGFPSTYRTEGEEAGTISFGDIAGHIPETELFQRNNVNAMSSPERELSYLNSAFVFRRRR